MNRTVFVCLLMLVATVAVPMTAGAAELRVGVQGGGNNASLAGTTPVTWDAYSARLRPAGGVVLELGLGPSFSLALEPSFAGKGAKLTDTRGVGTSLPKSDYIHNFSYDYVDLPLYAKYRFGQGKVRPYIGTGPYLGILTSARIAAEGTAGFTEDAKDGTESTDVGVAFGGGVELRSHGASFFLDGRYSV